MMNAAHMYHNYYLLSASSNMESLDPECTPLKHRYDSCFNLWFEGYLQPALDSRSTEILSSRLHTSSTPSSSSKPSPTQSATPNNAQSEPETEIPLRKPLITSWANAFRTRPRSETDDAPLEDMADPSTGAALPELQRSTYKIDTRGKTRAQIKAEEYEKACGEPWRLYQDCLKKAIAQNTSLSTLLEQARDEHPLASQEGLSGTAWDPEQREKA